MLQVSVGAGRGQGWDWVGRCPPHLLQDPWQAWGPWVGVHSGVRVWPLHMGHFLMGGCYQIVKVLGALLWKVPEIGSVHILVVWEPQPGCELGTISGQEMASSQGSGTGAFLGLQRLAGHEGPGHQAPGSQEFPSGPEFELRQPYPPRGSHTWLLGTRREGRGRGT